MEKPRRFGEAFFAKKSKKICKKCLTNRIGGGRIYLSIYVKNREKMLAIFLLIWYNLCATIQLV
jgi:hypothetical protein